MKRIASLALILFVQITFAQDFYYKTYNWEKQPVVYVPTSDEIAKDLIIVLDKSIYEVGYETNGQPVIYETKHTIYHVNNSKSIDAVNKGYISIKNVNEEIDLKARVITKANKIIYFNTETIKHIDDFENSGPFKIFAIDGVEEGCDVEMIYTNKKQFYSYSSRIVTSKSPIAQYEIHMISPSNLVYETKCYNGLNNFFADTSNSKKNHLVLSQKKIGNVESEKYSAEDANYMSYIIQLAYNSNKKSSKIYTWELIGKDYYTAIYSAAEKSEQKLIEKFLDKNKVSNQATNEEKVAAIESYLKENFEMNNNFDFDLKKSLELKKANDLTVLRIYVLAFKQSNIPFELAVTSNRDDFKFDAKFPSYIFMKDYLFYFNEFNKYLSPVNIFSRLGFPNPYNTFTDAVFIKEVTLGELTTSTVKIKNVAPITYTNSYHNYKVNAELDFENKHANLSVEQALMGYSAYYVQPIYKLLNIEQKEEYKKGYLLSENSENVKNYEVQNVEGKDVFKKPMIIKYTDIQNDFVENAGNKFIFKAGLLIGVQTQLYQEKRRKFNAEIGYTHSFKRDLEITIPKGYSPSNLKDFEFNTTCNINDNQVACFKSSYTIADNKIIITVYEDYRGIEYPLQYFDKFKEVINAAADFNKKSIIFEKN